MIRRIEWRETAADAFDRTGNLAGMRLRWEVRWFGEDALESGASSYNNLADSLLKTTELQPHSDYRMKGSEELGHFTMRFEESRV